MKSKYYVESLLKNQRTKTRPSAVMLTEEHKDANAKGGLVECPGQKTIKTTSLIQKLFLSPKISKLNPSKKCFYLYYKWANSD